MMTCLVLQTLHFCMFNFFPMKKMCDDKIRKGSIYIHVFLCFDIRVGTRVLRGQI